MTAAVARHYELLDRAVVAHDGYRPVEQGEGDSMVAVFTLATDAVAAAVDAQRWLSDELPRLFRVRMSLHTAEANLDGRFYRGEALSRAARIRACGHGGQILVSQPTADLLTGRLPTGVTLLPMGTYRLRDLARSEVISQVVAPGLEAEFPPLVTAEEPQTNLPVVVTPLIGRDGEKADLAAAMDRGARLVTLTGPGGVGKTRLALDVAAGRAAVAPDGIWWVDLAALDPGGGVAGAALRALGFVESPALTALDQLAASLARWRAVLVLDNCEQVIVDAARVADRLLQRCRDLTVMATSREPLAVSGETVWPISPLPVAEANDVMTDVVRSDGVRLFVERAQQASPTFEVDAHNVAAVGEVCRRLDGIPLALELAAARVRTMPLPDIVRGLEDRFVLLTGGGRTVLPRHQTMLASLMWSHDLLGEAEQRVFRRLWPFAGGFTVAAAVAVAGVDLARPECLEALAHLADRSLVQLDARSGRYLLLETMRQFAADRAAAAGETDLVRERHIDWVVEFLTSLDIAMLDDAALDAIDGEYPNIRLALEYAIATHNDHAVRIVMALAQYWGIGGRLRDAVELADPVLAELRERDARRWAWIVARLGITRSYAGDLEFVGSKTIPALEIAEAAEDWSTVGHCLQAKLNAELSSSAGYEHAFQTALRAGDRRLAVILAAGSPRPMLGTDEGERLLRRAWDLARGVDISGSRYVPDGLGAIHAALRGERSAFFDRARRCFAEKLRTPVLHLQLAPIFTIYGWHYGDHDLIDLVVHRIPDHWRDLPAQQAKFALFDRVVGKTERMPHPLPDEFHPTASRGLMLLDSVVRVLLDEDRDDEVIELTQSLSEHWPAAYTAGRLARAWVAYRRDDDSRLVPVLSSVLEDTGRWGIRLYEADAVELAAVRLSGDKPAVAAELLEAVDTARRDIGLHWRPSYQRAAVARAHATVRGLLAPERLTKARTLGAASTLAVSAVSAIHHLAGLEARR